MSADFWSEKENFITLKSADKLRKLGLTKIQDDKVLEIIGIERGSIKEMCRSVRDAEIKEIKEVRLNKQDVKNILSWAGLVKARAEQTGVPFEEDEENTLRKLRKKLEGD